MDKELQTYYESRFEMMSSVGWKQLVEDIEGMIGSTDHISGIATLEALKFKQGELSILNWIKGLQELTA